MAFLYFTLQNVIQNFYDFLFIKRLVVSILDFFLKLMILVIMWGEKKTSRSRNQFIASVPFENAKVWELSGVRLKFFIGYRIRIKKKRKEKRKKKKKKKKKRKEKEKKHQIEVDGDRLILTNLFVWEHKIMV